MRTNDQFGYSVGYGKPPLHSRFRKGVCPNPQGRGRKPARQWSKIVEEVLATRLTYREGGQSKRASRLELTIRRLVASALKGNPRDAMAILKLRSHALRHGDIGPLIINVVNSPNGEDGVEEMIFPSNR